MQYANAIRTLRLRAFAGDIPICALCVLCGQFSLLSLQFQQRRSLAKQFALNDMALHFRRPLDDPPRPRVAEGARDHMLLAQRRRSHRFEREVDDFMRQLGAEAA